MVATPQGSSPGGNCIFLIPVAIGWNCAIRPGTRACRSRRSRNSPIAEGPGSRGGSGVHLTARARVCSNVARRAAAGEPCQAQVAARTALLPSAVATTPCSQDGQPCVAGMTLVPRGSDRHGHYLGYRRGLSARAAASGPLGGDVFERPAGGLGETPGHEQRAEQRQDGQGADGHPMGRDHAIEEGLQEQTRTAPQGDTDQAQARRRRARRRRKQFDPRTR